MRGSSPFWTAQRLGAVVGAVLAIGWVVWVRTRSAPCSGAVTLEFHPPLTDPGTYHFRLAGPDLEPCEFAISLPHPEGLRGSKACRLARELRTSIRDGQLSVSELTFAAAPERFTLQVRRADEPLYDTALEPRYAPYPTARADNPRFCGDRARVVPDCLRGSSACAPYPTRCTGPEGCPHGQSCCLTPEWGREFGARQASECASNARCSAHFGQLACHVDSDCPSDMHCAKAALSADFSPSVLTCQPR